MKILLVIPTLGKGGAEKVVSNLSKGFSQLNHDVTVVIFSGPIEYPISGRLINYEVHSAKKIRINFIRKIKNLWNLAYCTYRLRKTINLIKPDQVLSFMEDANFCTLLSKKKPCISIRTTLPWISRRNRTISKYLYKFSKIIICPSEGLAKTVKKKYNLDHVKAIPNPVDLNLIEKVKNEPITIEGKFIFSAGRLTDVKNFILLIKSYELLNKKIKNFPKLVIAGEGEQREILELYIQEKKLNDYILLIGNIENPFKYMSKCEAFVLPSKAETFGNVIVEAMACGAVCISTNCPVSPKEIIQNGINGFLVKNNNLEELTSKLTDILTGEINKTPIIQEAKKTAKKYCIEKICLSYLSALS